MKLTSRSISSAKGKVFVGLSGGVDSAVSAALLLREGYEVTGVFLKTWSPDFLPCTWREERRDAMRVAARLGIPFLSFDFEEEYKHGVAEYMIEEYRQGRTPNPDVMCNKVIKFGAFWKKAKELGADFIATGHYAQIHQEGDSFTLHEGRDTSKDQSYFLWTLTGEDLSHTLFPVGNLPKSEVRKLAECFGLPVSDKKDSQGICFLGDVDIEEFLSHYIGLKPGDVLDPHGTIIGTHKSALLYTVGERHGFEITKKSADSKRFYVIDRDLEANTITVSDTSTVIESHQKREMAIEHLHFINESVTNCFARIRYHQEKFPVEIDTEASKVYLHEPQTAAAGQSIVFYLPAQTEQTDKCLGGAILS